MASDQEYDEATARGRDSLRTEPRAVAARYDAGLNLILVELNAGYTIAFPPARCQTLHTATSAELAEIEIDYPGFSLYFPRLDEGLSVTWLARGRFGNDRWEASWKAAHPWEAHPFPEAFQAEAPEQSEAA